MASASVISLGGKAKLRVEENELIAAGRYSNQCACRGVRWIAAGSDDRLWTGSIQRESTQRAAAAGEEFLADRHLAAKEGLQEAQPQTVRPDGILHLPVDRALSEQPSELEIRSEDGRIHADFDALVAAGFGIDRIVASIADPNSPERRKRRVQLIRRHQLRDQ